MAGISLLESHRDALANLCTKYQVVALDLFGSALTDRFSPESDLDFVVKFGPVPAEAYADNFFDFRDAMAELFQRKIDLVEVQKLSNPYFKQIVENTKQPVYARG